MKTALPTLLLALALCVPINPTFAAAPSDLSSEVAPVLGRIQTKVQAGRKSETDFASELSELDAIFAKHQAEKTDEVAQILLTKASLYFELFEDAPKCVALINQLKTEFPETNPGKQADAILKAVTQAEASKKIQSALVAGATFPGFSETDLAGRPLSLNAYKGKVVLIDFWATWCGPCVAELPNVLAAYRAYHDKGFEIIGISLDKDQNALAGFVREKDMRWPQFFDGKGWENKLAVKYGINSIPATYLLDGRGRIVAKDLRDNDLATQLAKLLKKR